MLKSRNAKASVYALKKSRKDAYMTYGDDEQCKDVGPAMIILRDEDEDDDRIDKPFPTAFSPTANNISISFDVDFSAVSEKQQETKSETTDLYAKVTPKSQRTKETELETSEDAPVANGKVAVSVDPYSQYAKVMPKSQRKVVSENSAVANGSAYGPLEKSDRQKQKLEARSRVLSAIGSQPVAVVESDYNEITYRRNVPTAQRIESALGGKVKYNESAEL